MTKSRSRRVKIAAANWPTAGLTLWCLQCSKAVCGLEAHLCTCETCETLHWTFKGSMLCLPSTHDSGMLLFTCIHKLALGRVAYKQSCREANMKVCPHVNSSRWVLWKQLGRAASENHPAAARTSSAEQAGLICSQDLFCSESDGKAMPLPTQEKETRLLCISCSMM